MSNTRSPNTFMKSIRDYCDQHPSAPRKPRRLAKAMKINEVDYPLFRETFKALRESGEISASTKKNTLVGKFRLNQRGFGFVIPEEPDGHPDVFVPTGSTHGALTGDLVVVEIGGRSGRLNRNPENREGDIVTILERNLHHVVGTLEFVEGAWFLEPDGNALTTPVLVDTVPPGELAPGTKVLVEIVEYPESPGMLPVGAVTEILGQEGELEIETQAIILTHGLPHRFSEDALEQSKRAVSTFSPEDITDREDLTDLLVITIDPEEARDFDDALSVVSTKNGTSQLGVHIADVAHFVPEGSPLDLDARDRGTSAYFPRRVVPMLPPGLSQGVCALKQDHRRFTLSVLITYDDQGVVLEREVKRSVITSRKRFTYEEAQSICDGANNDAPPEVAELLKTLEQLARKVKARRHKEGMLDLDLPEVRLVLDQQGHVKDARPADHMFSHTLIEMFMVEANEAVAELLSARGVPVIRRVHPSPTAEGSVLLRSLAKACDHELPEGTISRKKLQNLIASVRGRPEGYAVNLALLRSLRRARYSTQEEGHFALASASYCHFTSPIRRYPDLVVHRLISRYLLKSEGAVTENQGALEELAEHCSKTERRAENAEHELRQVLVLQHLSTRIGTGFTGVITGVTNFGLFVQSPRFLIEGLLPRQSLGDDWWELSPSEGLIRGEATGVTYRLGDVVDVTISRVDATRRHLDLALSHLTTTDRSGPRQEHTRGSKRRSQRKSRRS